jgi:hypothetical protein
MKGFNKQIKHFIYFILLLVSSIMIFSKPPQAPNKLVTENPKREVTTVEANKNREHAEMDITVKKLNLKSLISYKLSDLEFYIQLPKNETLNQDEVYFVSKTVDDIPNISTVNGKKVFSNLEKFKNYNIKTKDFIYTHKDNFILIDRAPLGINEFVVSKLNKTTGEIKQVYSSKDFKETPIETISGVIEPGNTHVIFNLSEEILKELTTKGNRIEVGTTFNKILTTNKLERKIDKEALTYTIEAETSRLLVEDKEKLNEIKILVFNKDGIKKIYKGDIFLPSIDKATNKAWLKYSPFRFPKLVPQSDGNFLVKLGHFVRGNRAKNINDFSYTDDGLYSWNFNLTSDYSMNAGNKDPRILYGTDVHYIVSSNLNPTGIELPKKHLYRDDQPLFGNFFSGDFSSTDSPSGKTLNMWDNTLTQGHYSSSTTVVGWFLSFELQFRLSREEYYNMRRLGLNKIKNKSRISGKIRSFSSHNPPTYVHISIPLIEANAIDTEFDESTIPTIPLDPLISEGTVTLKNPIYKKSGEKGGVLLFFGEPTLNAETQGYEQNIGLTEGEIGLFKPQLGYLGGPDVKITGKVTAGVGTPVPTTTKMLNLGSGEHLEEQVFISGLENNLTVSYPNATSNKNGTLIGINTWNLDAGEYQVKMDHRFLKNTINIKLPKFDSSVYYTALPDKEVKLSIHDRPDNILGTFKLTTKDYDVEILGKTGSISKFRYKIKKTLPVTVDGVLGSNIKLDIKVDTLKGTLVNGPDSNYWYIHSPVAGSMNVDVIVSTEDIVGKKNRTITTTIPSTENIIQLGVEGSPIGVSGVVDKIEITETYSIIQETATISLTNPIFAGTHKGSFGGLRIWSDGTTAKIGMLNENGIVENNSLYLPTVTGKTTSIQQAIVGDGTQMDVVINSETHSTPVNWGNATTSTGIIDPVYNTSSSKVLVGADYSGFSTNNVKGTDISLEKWNLEQQNVNIQMKHDLAINTFILKIPKFDGLVYYDYESGSINSTTKLYEGVLSNVSLVGEVARIKLHTKNYDLRILGSRNDDSSNLELKIPKTVILKVKGKNSADEEVDYNMSFKVEIDEATISGNMATTASTARHHILHPKSMTGYTNMSADIILIGEERSLSSVGATIELSGDKLNFVTIGVKDKPDFNKTILNKIVLKGNVATSTQVVDLGDASKGDTINGTTEFEALDNDKVELWNGTASLFPPTTTISTLISGIEIQDSQVSVKYDVSSKKLIFTKIGFKDYSNSNLKLNFLRANGLLTRTISLTVKNKVGFEILPGKGSLNFGDFFPGDTKFAENLIEFKNPNNHNIKVELDTNNKEEIYKVGVPATETTTINLKELQVKDLKATSTTKRNSFKISGKAVTKATTEPGEYRGSLDVLITIIP